MLAKALARECDACFINLKASTILSKWYGDTNKLIAAVWTLAYKIQPTILFIDEVDSLLGARRSMEHEATTAMKTEFMQLWEGFETMANNNVVVLGATNKRDALDDAVLRRFSLQYEVKLPGLSQREAILKLMLKRHGVEVGQNMVDNALLEDVSSASSAGGDGDTSLPNGSSSSAAAAARQLADPRVSPLRDIAARTEGYSGSDLSELCSQAAAIPVHEYIASVEQWEKGRNVDGEAPTLEPLSKHHFEQVLAHIVPPSRAAQAAQRQRTRRGGGGAGSSPGLGMFSAHDVDAMGAAIATALLRGFPNPFPINEEEDASDEPSA